MRNLADVVKLDDNFDEEVLMSINSREFVAFIAYAPYPISCNKEYPVEISFFTDEVDVQESDSDIKELNREGDTFRYAINGYLTPNG